MKRGNTSDKKAKRIARRRAITTFAAVVPAGLLTPSPVTASTAAGPSIANTATLTFTIDGTAKAVTSNTVTLQAAEILNVTIAADRATVATRGTGTVAVGFVVANGGNGQEDFVLAASSGSPAVATDRLAIDSDGDGVYTAATDQALAPGAAVPLASGQTVRVFVLVDGAQIGTGTTITARATARTGSGTAGTVFPATGDAGSDAIVGATGATASAASQLVPDAGLPTLTKTQSVRAPDGSARAVPGSVITYQLVASFPGATRGVVMDDPVPAGTAYVPGSLRLDDAVLSDAADGDGGTATAAAIRVALGDVPGAGTRTIQFRVKIQ